MTDDPAVRPASPADDLVRQGTALAADGRLSDAARLYEKAAAVHRRAHRSQDEARCLALHAQALRLAGDIHGSYVAIGRARRLARPGTLTGSVVAQEKAEVDVAHGDLRGAVIALGEALAWQPASGPNGGSAEAPGAPRAPGASEASGASGASAESGASGASGTPGAPGAPMASASARSGALLRRRALLRTGLGDAPGADADFVNASLALAASGDGAAARRVLVERATAAWNLRSEGFATALADARGAAAAAGDSGLGGELDLLEAAVATASGRLEDAAALARQARESALDAVDPVLYTGASASLAELADLGGDRVGAYAALAVGWATLGDLLGRDGAAAVFRPRMEALEARWGTEAFADARASYEERRRAELEPARGDG